MISEILVWNEWCCELSILSIVPVDSFKYCMLFNLIECGSEAWVLYEDRLQEATYETGNARRVPCLTLYHILVDHLRIIIIKRSLTRYDLAYQDA